MEIRKLQLIGGSSYMVSLPKSWIDANSLQKGDELILHIDSNHIRIHPRNRIPALKGSIKLKRYDSSFLKRFMHSLYVQGLDEVVVEGSFTPELITKMSDVARGLIGMEIIDAKSDRVVLKFIAEVELGEIINRLFQIVSTMLHLLEKGIEENRSRELLEVAKLERDADRLYMLAVRQGNRLLREACSGRLCLRSILGTRVVAKHLEDLADMFYDFAVKASVSPQNFSDLLPLLREVKKVFEKAVNAYVEGDAEMAEEAIKSAEQLEKANGEFVCISRQIRGLGEVALNKAVRESILGD
ncbi:MAG: phosphate uptake regulator PhoU [Archaeoglobales archaeon]|nr:MAG: phosphate uptake regulator PhoU [Archaeoglobales archaeon]